MGTIGTSGVDTLSLPKELASYGSPFSVLKVGSTRWVLLAVFSSEEEEFVGTTVRTDELGVSTPIKSHDVRAVTSAFTMEFPVAGCVDIDMVVVGTDGEIFTIWGEGHDLNPLSGVSKKMQLSGISGCSD